MARAVFERADPQLGSSVRAVLSHAVTLLRRVVLRQARNRLPSPRGLCILFSVWREEPGVRTHLRGWARGCVGVPGSRPEWKRAVRARRAPKATRGADGRHKLPMPACDDSPRSPMPC